jgi:hypothetical protein
MKKIFTLLTLAICLNVNAQVCFNTATNFATGSSPESIIYSDFNGDGIIDLATANDGGNDVSVLLGNGSGGFSSANNFSAGLRVRSIASADFNGDGYMDLATANYNSNNASILLGTGTGTFSAATNFTAGTGCINVSCADFNLDGKIDIAVVNYFSSDVSILLGTGTGSFGSATNFTLGTSPYFAVTGDFNKDGKLDLGVTNSSSNNVSVLLGTGTGSFGTAVNYAVATTPISVTCSDFNLDGNVDLATANFSSNNVSVLLGNGLGGFGSASNFIAATGVRGIISADYNGDGKPDLATTNYSSNNVSVLLGTGTGSFSAPTSAIVGANPYSLISADFNKDGKIDIAAVNSNSDNISILLNCTTFCTGSFASVVNYSVSNGTYPSSVTSADFNGDGKVDLAISSGALDNVGILLGNGTGSFGVPTTYASQAMGPISVISADFNKDGKMDIALADNTAAKVSILLGSGTGTFGTATTFITGGIAPRSVINADFNSDGNIDLAIASGNLVSVLLGTGTGSFGTPTTFALSGAVSLTSADFNSDGKIDLAAVNINSNTLSVLLGTGTGSFGSASSFVTGINPYSITSADFNGDGKMDLAVANSGSNDVSLLLGTGTGSFSIATNFSVGNNPHFITSSDLNGDGKIDLAVANNLSNDLSVLFGLGTGSFTATINFATGNNPSFVRCDDFNNDGKMDIAVVNNYSDNFSILLTSTPGAPSGTAVQSFCASALPTIANLVATGTAIQWYAAPTGGIALAPSTTLINNTHYYASQTVSSCGGESLARLDITTTINPSPSAPTGIASQIFCSATVPKVVDLLATGTATQWYAASSGGSPLQTTTALTDNTHYYATQTINGCESLTRLDVTATVTTTPNDPTGAATQAFCSGALPTVNDLSATGNGIQWYTASNGGTLLTSNTALTDNVHYFASQTTNNCESSARLDVTATITTTPPTPTGTATQSFCSSTLPAVSNLIVTGTGIQWYDAANGGTLLQSSTALIDNTHYYSVQTVNNCESQTRLDITAIVNTTPIVTASTTDSTVCAGDSTLLNAGGAASYIWTNGVTDGVAFPPDSTRTYTVTGTATNLCTSTATITIIVNSLPTINISATNNSFCAGDSTVLTASGAVNYVWTDGVVNGVSFAPATTHTYTVTATSLNSCSSTTTKTITVIQLPDVTTSLNGTTLTAAQTGASYQWINCDNDNAPLFGQFNKNFTATANGNYAVVVVKNGCTDTSTCMLINNVGIIENSTPSAITIYPNPFDTQTTIHFMNDQKNTSVKITDVMGKEVKTLTCNGKLLLIERGELPNGVYFIQIRDKNNVVLNKKIVIQ